MQRFLLLLFIFTLLGGLTAQSLYTVKVGTFRDVKAADFTDLKSKGFVYGAPGPESIIDVYLGQYTDQATVNTVTADLQASGFRNAVAYSLPLTTGQPVTVIQIALHSGNHPIDWPTLERAGQLYVEAIDGVKKIMTGIYPDAQTAAGFLPAIRALGYTDAFVRTVNNVRLIPITSFETGIKKPLIPINMQGAKDATPLGAPTGPPASTGDSPAPQPVTYGQSAAVNPPTAYPPPATNTPATPPTTTLPAPATSPNVTLPAIDGKTKRESSAKLQRVLKEKGYYDGDIDGFYGPGTTAAYNKAWDDMPEIRKYRKLSEMVLSPAGTQDLISEWPEVTTLLAVAEDLSAGMTNSARARQLAQQRSQLREARQPLSPVAAERVKNWAAALWNNMDEWATEDPLHAQIYSAFRLSFYQSQVRIEDYYMDRGLSPLDARDLTMAMLQNLVGAQLDRFL